MASREFLKTMKEARQGDVFSQQRLGEIYLNGEFGTPKQAANALIWFEKAYKAFALKGLNDRLDGVCALVIQLPFSQILSSPASEFAWQCFVEAANQNNLIAQWQIGSTLLEADGSPVTHLLIAKYFDQFFPNKGIREQAIMFLENVAQSNSEHSQEALDLVHSKRPLPEKIQLLWSQWLTTRNNTALLEAAELGFPSAQLALGLKLAKIQESESESKPETQTQTQTQIMGVHSDSKTTGSASLKKAVQWLTLAAKQGNREAWYNLALIYRRAQFSGYNAEESDRCFDQAADLGHPEAQFRKGSLLWRKRAHASQPTVHSHTSVGYVDPELPELKASYWIWQAAQQGVPEAVDMLSKILSLQPNPRDNLWFDMAQKAKQALDKGSHVRLPAEWVQLCHRIIVGNQFSLTKAEMLLVDISKMQHEHCVVVDIREFLPKIHPRLIQINTLEQRKSLLLASKVFARETEQMSGLPVLEEGNLRQRRYRFDKFSEWLNEHFA